MFCPKATTGPNDAIRTDMKKKLIPPASPGGTPRLTQARYFWNGFLALCTSLALCAPAFGNQPPGTGTVTVSAVNGSCLAFTPSKAGGPDNFEVAQGGT